MDASDLLYRSLIASLAVWPGLSWISSLPSAPVVASLAGLGLLRGRSELAVSSVTSTCEAELDPTSRTLTMLGGGRRVTWPWWVYTLLLNSGAAVSARSPRRFLSGLGGAVGSGAVLVETDDVGNDIALDQQHTSSGQKERRVLETSCPAEESDVGGQPTQEGRKRSFVSSRLESVVIRPR